jgi:hypothetical protein
MLVMLLVLLFIKSTTQVFASEVMWNKTYGPVEGVSVVQINDGGYAIVETKGDYIPPGGFTNTKCVLIKIDWNGDVQWNKTIIDASPSANKLFAYTTEGGYAIAVGVIIPWRTGVWLAKLDADGNQEWNSTYQEPGYYALGTQLVQTRDSGYVLVGSVWGDEWTSGKGYKAWVVKIDHSGNVQWQQTYDNFSSLDNRYAYRFSAGSIVEDVDGGYVFTCWAQSDIALLVKLDSDGNVQWEKKIEGDGIGFRSIIKADEGFLLTGTKDNLAFVMKTDSLGNQEWSRTIESLYVVNSAVHSKEDGYLFAGTTYSLNASSLIRTDSQGNIQWLEKYFGLGQAGISSVLQSDDGGYVFTGWTGPSDSSERNIWLVKTDEYGAIPEFPSYSLLVILVVVVALTIICRRRLAKIQGMKET